MRDRSLPILESRTAGYDTWEHIRQVKDGFVVGKGVFFGENSGGVGSCIVMGI